MTAITAWALDVAQRTVKTFAQTLVGMLGAGALSVLHVAWQTDLDVAAFAALVCVLQNVSSFPTPSLVPKPAPLTPAQITAIVAPADVPLVTVPLLDVPPPPAPDPVAPPAPPAAG